MFSSLKEKLKVWISKVTKDESSETSKKVKVKSSKKRKKEKLIEPIKKFNVAQKNFEPDIEVTEENLKQIIKQQASKKQEQEDIKEIQEPKEKKGFSFFSKKLTNEKFDELFEELKLILIQNNVAYEVVEKIKMSLGEKLIGKNLKEIDLETELKNTIKEILQSPPDFIKEIKSTLEVKKPFVILFAGINGSGKTTTIAKVANLLKKNKLSVCLAAADTFRSAAIQQLEEHANKLKIPIIKKDYGSDPASVGFDAIAYAKKHRIDVVLIDTAGRMQNKDSLMKEIEKISRVNKPNMKIFLGESITGNDATEQAKTFNDTIALTGIILSKADIDEKGGTALSVSYITKKPILFLGTGQSYEDLEVFDKKKIIKNLGL